MHWVEQEKPSGRRLGRASATQILRLAIEKSPSSLALHERLGEALMEEGKYPEAIAAFSARAQAEPESFTAWGKLAQCHLEIDDPASALEISNRGDGQGIFAALARGRALEDLGRNEEALKEYRRAFAQDNKNETAVEAVLRCLCRAPDAAPLLEFCEALPAGTRYDAQRRAFSALAFSRLGRPAEAATIIDPDRHVMIFRFQPPAVYGGIEKFNARLAAWLTANMGLAATPRPDCIIDYGLKYVRDPILQDLRAFFRESLEAFIAKLPALGLDAVMPAPASADLAEAVTFLRNDGRNGEHVHPHGYLSAVYYVQVPEIGSDDSERRGWLAVGRCENLTAGYKPAWETRYIKPEPGMLVVFPAHMFHDVVPTQSMKLRIAVAMDVRPAS